MTANQTAAEKAARIAEETIRTAQACQAIVATGVNGAELAIRLMEATLRGECRVKEIVFEPPTNEDAIGS